MGNTNSFFRREHTPRENDLGFGTKVIGSNGRLINKDGTFNIIRTGYNGNSPYQWLVEMSWYEFTFIIFIFYVTVNAMFALILVAIGADSLSGVESSSFLEDFSNCFFFCIQTFTTVGYGAISPQNWIADIIASICALIGLIFAALSTGIFFARFSKPQAKLLFSDNAIIAPYQNGTSLQFRIANTRNNKIINLQAQMAMTWIEEFQGSKRRRFALMEMERTKISMLPLNWTIVHPIDKDSPLWGKTAEDLERVDTEFIILIEGYDETFAQNIHASSSYMAEEVVWDVKFAPMYWPEEQHTVLALDKINEHLPANGS